MNFSLASRYDGLSTDAHKCAPKGNSAGVVLSDEPASGNSDSAIADNALTPEILAGVIERACASMQRAMSQGDTRTARRFFRRICRLEGLAEQMREGQPA